VASIVSQDNEPVSFLRRAKCGAFAVTRRAGIAPFALELHADFPQGDATSRAIDVRRGQGTRVRTAIAGAAGGRLASASPRRSDLGDGRTGIARRQRALALDLGFRLDGSTGDYSPGARAGSYLR
jgi:hypothetical protein